MVAEVEVAALAGLLAVEPAAVVLVVAAAAAAAAVAASGGPAVVAEGLEQLSASLLMLSQPLLLPWSCQCPFASGNGRCTTPSARRNERKPDVTQSSMGC